MTCVWLVLIVRLLCRHRRFDNNYQLTGPVPSNINNLTKLAELWVLLFHSLLSVGLVAGSYNDLSPLSIDSFCRSTLAIWKTTSWLVHCQTSQGWSRSVLCKWIRSRASFSFSWAQDMSSLWSCCNSVAGTWATTASMHLVFLPGSPLCHLWPHCKSLCTPPTQVQNLCLKSESLFVGYIAYRYLENLRVTGQLPQALFSLPAVQTLWVSSVSFSKKTSWPCPCRKRSIIYRVCRRLRGNRFNGTLTIGSDYSTQLQLIDLRDNQISQITVGGSQYNKQLM